jgi:phage shock protein C
MERKFKLSKDAKLAGVCGGIAEYFNVDPTLIRLVWALVTLCTVCVGLIGYLICAVIMPKKSEVIG